MQSLHKVAEATQITIKWVPDHEDKQSKELADELVRKGAGTRIVGPEQYKRRPGLRLLRTGRYRAALPISYMSLFPAI